MVIQVTTIRALDPTTAPRLTELAVAPRLEDLKGMTIGILCNSKSKSEPFFQVLSDLLRQQYHVKEVVLSSKGNSNRPAPPEMVEDLAQRCDAVIVGVGD